MLQSHGDTHENCGYLNRSTDYVFFQNSSQSPQALWDLARCFWFPFPPFIPAPSAQLALPQTHQVHPHAGPGDWTPYISHFSLKLALPEETPSNQSYVDTAHHSPTVGQTGLG